MELSILLLEQMLSMLLMILMGYGAVKAGIVESRQSAVISALTLYIIVPCVVVNSLQIEFTLEKLEGLLLAAGFAIVMHFLFIGLAGLPEPRTPRATPHPTVPRTLLFSLLA